MKKKFASFRLPSLLSLMLLTFSFSSKAQIDLVVNSPLCFSAMDNNPVYDEDLVAGQITVHSLLIQNGGSISYNDPGHPCSDAGAPNSGAKPVTIIVINDMEIEAGGFINTENKIQGGNGGDITLTIGGTFIMRGPNGAIPGSKISSGNLTATSGNKNAGSIIIHVIGDVDLEPGSTISAFSFKGTAGWVEITSQNNIDIDGNVLSRSTGSGSGTNQGHGGVIWITAVKNLFVSDEGVISSKGVDPGADLVHLCACSVVIYGLVESTGSGHGIPSNPPNHLNSTFRPDKKPNSTAGVEIWSGSTILIDNLNHNGEINADLCCAGGANGESWIDLLAVGSVTIIGKTVAYNSSIQNSNFAVHANGTSGNTDNGGTITIKSVNSTVTASGLAVQADGTEFGGSVAIEAKTDVTLNNATLFARGDAGFNGGNGKGGFINIRSFQGAISWTNGVGDVRPTGGTIPEKGLITFKKCLGAVNTSGTGFPNNGAPATSPQTLADDCNGSPSVEPYVSFCECDSDPREVICQLSGPRPVCAGTTGHVYDGGPIPDGYTFKWTVLGAGASINGGIDDQQTVTIDAGSVNYIVTLTMDPDDPTLDDQVCIYQVTVNTNPAIYTLTGSSICPGATGSVTLADSETGVSYQLKNSVGDVDVQLPKAGTDLALVWTDLDAGTYYVVATGALPTECTSQTDPASITEVDGPTIFDLTGSSICESDPNTGTVTLSDSEDGVSYQLKKSSDDSDVQLPKDGDGSSLTWTGLAAGDYYVVATSDEFTCSSQTDPASVITVDDPEIYTLTGSAICESDPNTGTVTLSNSQTGVSYQLKNDANDADVQGPKNGSNGNSLIWTGLAAGTYYVVATGAAPTECTSETSPASVTTVDDPEIYTLTGSSFCPGNTGSVTLSNSQTGVSYQLKNDANDANVQAPKNGSNGNSLIWTGLAAGSYYVVATGAAPTSCTSETDPALVQQGDGPAIYTLTGSSICSSDPNTGTVTLSNSQTGVSYQLKNNANDADVQAPKNGSNGNSLTWTSLAAGSYYVVASGAAFTCTSRTQPASVTTVNDPTVYTLSGSSVCAGNTGSVTLSNSQTGVSYQLKNDANDADVQAPKNGSNGNSLTWTGLAPGTYYVLATGAAPTECDSETSPASVSETVCDGHIFPTATACSDFVSGTPELDGICLTYGNNGKVSNATPGVFFYYTFITAPSSSFTVNIVQTAGCSNKLFAIQKDQIIAWTSPGCSKLTTGTESPKGSGQAQITINGVTAGQIIVISVKYDTKSIIGATLTSPCTFNFVAKIGGVDQPNSDGSIVASSGCNDITLSNQQVQQTTEVSEIKNAFSVYPNPVRSVARINYTLSSTQAVSVKVFNSVGKEITTLVNTKQAAGIYNIEWNAGRLAAGSYFVQIRTGNEMRVRKLILVK